jgi:phenylpyruvate tautomerase PptA (4-oxalocrotonate tautomerase family)
MPLYTVSTQCGVLSGEAKAALAEELTAFHCAYSDVPRPWVHVIFQEYAPGNGYTAGKAAAAAALTLLIRTGSLGGVQAGAHQAPMGDPPGRHPRAPDDQIVIGIQEVPPSQAMEMGQIMPEVESSSAAIPGTPAFSKWTIRIGFLQWRADTCLSAIDSFAGSSCRGEPR